MKDFVTYAGALVLYAKKKDKLSIIYQNVMQLQELIDRHSCFMKYFGNSFYDKQIRKDDLIKGLQQNFEKIFINWLCVLIDESLFTYLPKILTEFRNQYYDLTDQQLIQVYTPIKLNSCQEKNIIEMLEQKNGKKIVIENIVDPSLIAGLQIKIGSKFYDNSYKTKLKNLRLFLEGRMV